MHDRPLTFSVLDHTEALRASVTLIERDDMRPRMTGFAVDTADGTDVRKSAARARELLERLGLKLETMATAAPAVGPEELAPDGRPPLAKRPPWPDLRKTFGHKKGAPARIAEHYGVDVKRVYAWLRVGRKLGEIPAAIGPGRPGRAAITAGAS